MNLKNQVFYNAVIALSLVALPAMASDTTTGVKVGEGKPAMCAKKGGCGNKLSLSNEQLVKFGKLKEGVITSSASEIAELKTLRIELKQTLAKPVINRDEAMSIQNKINGVRGALADQFLGYRIDKMNVLTQEQKEKLDHKLLVGSAFNGKRHREFTRKAKLS